MPRRGPSSPTKHVLFLACCCCCRLAVLAVLSGPPTLGVLAFASTSTSSTSTRPGSFSTLGMTPTETPPVPSEATTSGDMRFGKFLIPNASVFCRTPASSTGSPSPSAAAFAFVNLRPIVPGHVLVAPVRVVPHLSDLTEEEYTNLWGLVRTVQSVLKKAHAGTTAFNVAVQDGRAAGQSVPHVHVHILPRNSKDFERNDDVYDALEAWAPTEAMASAKKDEPSTDMEVPDDADRMDRTVQAMADEAAVYRGLLGDGTSE